MVAGFFLPMMLFIVGSSDARSLIDMIGRTVTVPEKVTRVYSSSPPCTYMIYALDPDLLVGLNFPPTEQDKRYLRRRVPDLPVIGGFFGKGQTANVELLLKVKPDVIAQWISKRSVQPQQTQFEATMTKLGIPVFYLDMDTLSDYTEGFLALGRLLGREERARHLSRYGQQALMDVKKAVRNIPANERRKVYYAEGVDGLSTECDSSMHAEIIELAGGVNVLHCDERDPMGLDQVSLEQVMVYNPDVMVVQEKVFFDAVFHDPRWQNVRAVKEKKVLLVPRVPFNWFDRPPSFMRFLGLKWLANSLYPGLYRIDIVKETKEFYRLFLDIDVGDAEIQKVIYR